MVTIAVPAYNEEERLPALLTRLERCAPAEVAEVLVCDSLSDDCSAQIVADWERRDPRVRLVRADRPGKASAWNQLLAEASSPLVFFIDADVLPREDCLACALHAAAQSRKRLVFGCRRRAAGVHPLLRLLADPVIEMSLAGGCYLLRRQSVLDRLRERGFERMPDVLAEDVWLQSLLERDEFQLLDECVFDFDPGSFRAHLRVQARKRLAARELSEEYPELARALHRNFPEFSSRAAQAALALSGDPRPLRKIRWFAAGAAKALVDFVCARSIKRRYREFSGAYETHGGGHVLRHLASSRHAYD